MTEIVTTIILSLLLINCEGR